VVNNLVGFAHLTGEVLIMSDGTPWRPLVHVQDVARTFLAVLDAPRDEVHNQAFNVGSNAANHQIRDVAAIVADVVTGSRVAYAPEGSADSRCYRVDFVKLQTAFPDLAFEWDVRMGAEELLRAYRQHGLTLEQFIGPSFTRLLHIRESMQAGLLDDDLRHPVPAVGS
jgi:nucleoside-diphosphate-sugar epimerase